MTGSLAIMLRAPQSGINSAKNSLLLFEQRREPCKYRSRFHSNGNYVMLRASLPLRSFSAGWLAPPLMPPYSKLQALFLDVPTSIVCQPPFAAFSSWSTTGIFFSRYSRYDSINPSSIAFDSRRGSKSSYRNFGSIRATFSQSSSRI